MVETSLPIDRAAHGPSSDGFSGLGVTADAMLRAEERRELHVAPLAEAFEAGLQRPSPPAPLPERARGEGCRG